MLNKQQNQFDLEKRVEMFLQTENNIEKPCLYCNYFSAINKPKVIGVINVEEVIYRIKSGDIYLQKIKMARKLGKKSPGYIQIKEKELPTFRFNFLFSDTASNANITSSTGLIYIDIDVDEEIIPNKYVYAMWRSLSGKGYGILVKVDNLNLENFTEAYNSVSALLGINADKCAGKPSQQTVLSNDPDLYFNPDSTIYSELNTISIKPFQKVSETRVLKREKGSGVNDTQEFPLRLRFNNIDEYFKEEYKDCQFRYFKDMVAICNPKLFKKMESGKRNNIMFWICTQIAYLNPSINEQILYNCATTINFKMIPPLQKGELYKIASKVYSMLKRNELRLILNEKRRVLVNPKFNFTGKERQAITAKVLGMEKKLKRMREIFNCIEDWDFEKYGFITQKKISIKLNLSLPTIKRYFKNFIELKEFIEESNRIYIHVKAA